MLQAGIMRRQDGRRECAWSKHGSSSRWWVVEVGMGSVYLNGLEGITVKRCFIVQTKSTREKKKKR